MAELKRSLNLFLISFYAIGTILGAGIYVLVGEVASTAGMYAGWSFLLAAVVAGFSGVSYMELSSRYPKSAGEVVYLRNAINSRWLSVFVGWLVVFTGVVSSATISNGFVGYLGVFVDAPDILSIPLLVVVLVGVAIIGVTESVWIATVITIIEIAGICIVIAISGDSLMTIGDRLPELLPPMDMAVLHTISLGAIIAFYAFIGFEDIVNMAEEVKQPEKNLPRAIIISLVVSTLLYMVVAFVALLSLPMDVLVASKAPFADIVAVKSSFPPELMTIISLIAVVNGALIQIIMASRVLYGMARQGDAPAKLATLSERTQTPWIGIIFVGVLVLCMALWFPLGQLAVITSFSVLVIFALVNISLLIIKARNIPAYSEQHAQYHMMFPIIGLITCVGLIVLQASTWF